jgi:hypothetical protein
MKTWIIGIALSCGLPLLAPVVRKWLIGLLRAQLKAMYVWLFSIPDKLDYTMLPQENREAAHNSVSIIIEELVRLEELMIPDSGLGEDKKKRVIDRLKTMGFPDEISGLFSMIIDDAVKTMDEEAKIAITPKPALPPNGITPC